MDPQTRRLLAELDAIAASVRDPARRREVRRIIARLARPGREWPDAAELMRLRVRCDGGPG